MLSVFATHFELLEQFLWLIDRLEVVLSHYGNCSGLGPEVNRNDGCIR